MAIVSLRSGEIFSLQTNIEIAKFLLFTVPKIGGSEVIGELPSMKMDEEVQRLLKVSSRLRGTRIARAAEAMKNGGFDEDIPF